ncbi:hypothetical protein [Streptomyces sp. enrichment culture]|uniref:hypothetical protein n=1 Tax=Streptomyces sp. enrichment culture TaxID=1795815 RepID=UPI003F546DE9
MAVPDVDQLHAFLVDRFSRRREIVDFRSDVIYQHASTQVVSPLRVPPCGRSAREPVPPGPAPCGGRGRPWLRARCRRRAR